MNPLQHGRALTDQSISQLFQPQHDAELQGYAALGLLQVEFEAIHVPNATGWRHLMRLHGFGLVQGEFDLKSAAEMLVEPAWTRHDFLELLDGIRAEVGADPAVSLPVLYRRLRGHVSQLKEAP